MLLPQNEQKQKLSTRTLLPVNILIKSRRTLVSYKAQETSSKRTKCHISTDIKEYRKQQWENYLSSLRRNAAKRKISLDSNQVYVLQIKYKPSSKKPDGIQITFQERSRGYSSCKYRHKEHTFATLRTH
jgi:hypothetical protein